MDEVNEEYPFLRAFGNTATQTRNQDWSRHPLGEPDNWPAPLQTAVNIVLNSPLPMFLLWGKQFILFYNDAFSSVGKADRYGSIGRIASEGLSDLWDMLKPAVEQVYSQGKAISVRDHSFERKECYHHDLCDWSFFLTPVAENNGSTGGLLATCIHSNHHHRADVTEQLITDRAIQESEAKFRSLIEEAPVATCLFVGPDMRVELANDVMLSYWGKDASVLGLPLREAVPELNGQPFLEILDRIYKTGETHSDIGAEAQLNIGGKLDTYYFDFTYKPLRNADGDVYAIMDMAVDVTRQTLYRQQLETVEISLRSAIELAELATWEIDIVKKKIRYSERLNRWLGMESAELEIDASPRIHPKDQERVGNAMRNAMQSDANKRFDEVYTIVNKITGQERIIHSIGIARFDDDGKVVAVSGTSRDVTLQHEMETALKNQVQLRTEELAATNDDLQRSNEELSRYAYIASHDLQEPLRKIRIFSDLLSAHVTLSDQGNIYLKKISESAARMTQLIRDLLEFSSLVSTAQDRSLVDLNTVIREIEKDFELLIAEKNAVLQVAELPSVMAISIQMQQLFFNLINNALKFSQKDKQPVIEIFSQKATREEIQRYLRKPDPLAVYHKITVRDNGIGFEKEFEDKIFEVFARLHRKEVYAGSGIGLALCRRIVAGHNGFIYATSSPDSGATFNIIIPGVKD